MCPLRDASFQEAPPRSRFDGRAVIDAHELRKAVRPSPAKNGMDFMMKKRIEIVRSNQVWTMRQIIPRKQIRPDAISKQRSAGNVLGTFPEKGPLNQQGKLKAFMYRAVVPEGVRGGGYCGIRCLAC